MHVVYALDPIPGSIALLGPTPRFKPGQPVVPSWRPGALAYLDARAFDGTVYVPETADWGPHEHYDHQIGWEWTMLLVALVHAFWIPRDLEVFPAFTSNVEFGFEAASSKAILGYPKDAPKMSYLHALAERYNVPVVHTLPDLLDLAIERAKRPFPTRPLPLG